MIHSNDLARQGENDSRRLDAMNKALDHDSGVMVFRQHLDGLEQCTFHRCLFSCFTNYILTKLLTISNKKQNFCEGSVSVCSLRAFLYHPYKLALLPPTKKNNQSICCSQTCNKKVSRSYNYYWGAPSIRSHPFPYSTFAKTYQHHASLS